MSTSYASSLPDLRAIAGIVNGSTSHYTDTIEIQADINGLQTDGSNLDEWVSGTVYPIGSYVTYLGAVYYRYLDILISPEVPPGANPEWAYYWSVADGWPGFSDSKNYRFNGIINGNGHTISNIFMAGSARGDADGFGFINNSEGYGSVNNLTLANVNITSSKSCTGGMQGWVRYMTYNNCHVTGTLSGVDKTGLFCGGAFDNTSFLSCSTEGDVACTDGGGFVGSLSGSVGNLATADNCWANTDVVGTTGSVGGFLSSNWNIGGIATKCYATGNVTTGGNCAGGFVGLAYGTCIECYSTGNATAVNRVGGFAGVLAGPYNGAGATGYAYDCYSTGSATSTANEKAGSFVGLMNDGEAYRCHGFGEVNVDHDTMIDCGGFVGGRVNDPVVSNCYYCSDNSGFSDTGYGEPLTTAQYTSSNSFTGFDFNTVWYTDYAAGMPCLLVFKMSTNEIRNRWSGGDARLRWSGENAR